MAKSQYLNTFYADSSRKTILEIINDFYSYDSFPHFLKKNVAESMIDSPLGNWKQKFRTSNYMEMTISTFLTYIKVLTRIQGIKKNLTKQEKDKLKDFYKKNSWRSLFKNIAKFRRLYGDVYIYWFIDNEGIPILNLLPSKYIEIMENEDGSVQSYVLTKTLSYQERMGNTTTYQTKTKNIQIVFTKGKVEVYENSVKVKTQVNKLEYMDYIPIIHLQYLKEEDSPYSEIPAETLIDLCLELDRIETDIGIINNTAGSPTLNLMGA